MTPELLAGAAVFGVVTTVTPGPNNVMVLASGLHHGYRRTVPHLLGIAVGVLALTACCGAGIGAVVLAFPPALAGLRVAASLYLLHLAWRTARGSATRDDAAPAPPLGFVRALLFQFANPKAWFLTLGAVAEFARPGSYAVDVVALAAILAALSVPSTSVWAAGGQALRRILRRRRAMRAFDIAMAVLLVASVVPVAVESVPR